MQLSVVEQRYHAVMKVVSVSSVVEVRIAGYDGG